MKNALVIGLFGTLVACTPGKQSDQAALPLPQTESKEVESPVTEPVSAPKEDVSKPAERQPRRYTDQELEDYHKRISRLPHGSLMGKVAFTSDSIFRSREQLNITINDHDFLKLKQGCRAGRMDIETAKKIFKGNAVDAVVHDNGGSLPLTFISFDKNKSDFREFAVALGYIDNDWDCALYFFSGKKIVSKHSIHHRYGLELDHYTDADGKTVIYYKENFGSGSGIWWFNYYFYKYDEDQLIPVLNELEEANCQFPWGNRVYTLKSTILKTSPLTIKMVYTQAFSDSPGSPQFINDSTVIRYTWDADSRMLVGAYGKSKLTKAQILTYYLENNDSLFINAYGKTLSRNLQVDTLRQRTLDYLVLLC